MTAPWTPPQQIEGEQSSLAKLGHEGGVTLAQDRRGRKPTTAQQPLRSLAEALAGRKKGNDRYVIEGEIARGGMGAVLRAIDGDLRREVAVKYMLDEKDPKKKARFIEEAQINAQLEHPNIVPVYDLRLDAQHRPYLMMKLVKGRDLKNALDQLRENPRQAEKEWPLPRLLNIFTNVCNGLAFAHAHGVIHRDLKPANIMLGDFGEVYVMDWGLAKVLKGDGISRIDRRPSAVMPASKSSAANNASKVQTNREAEADLTQEGSILGTPVYMSPEQATGNLRAVDQRSDVYALGALLYEMLTLQPPIEKEGGYTAIVMRVALGEIVPPEQREPMRARVGKIPRELAAIAMKALAKEQGQRYANVGELRKDIERFQEGRSVSAKEDTRKEMIWKFVKRNKGFSAGVVTAFLVLAVSLCFLATAYWEVSKAKGSMEQANAAREAQLRESVPVFVAAAKLSLQQRQFDAALKQVDLALAYKEDHFEARLLRAQLLIGRKDLAGAEKELALYLKLQPHDDDSRKLLELCKQGQTREASWGEMSVILQGQQVTVLAERLAQNNRELLGFYHKRLTEVWPNQFKLTQDPDGRLRLDFSWQQPIRDLRPLSGMNLSHLGIRTLPVSDLSPLQGMPLVSLDMTECGAVSDVRALKGMPLRWLSLAKYVLPGPSVRDLTPLEGMKLEFLRIPERVDKGMNSIRQMSTLKDIGFHFTHGMPPTVFWRNYDEGKFPALKP